MNRPDQLRADLGAAIRGAESPLGAADQLCRACVDLLEVDGASISLTHEGSTRGTFGSSGELSRHLDELQFTFGEGPCLDAVEHGSPVLVSNLEDTAEQRWPAFRGALLDSGVKAVFALPVRVATDRVGALDLFRRDAGSLTEKSLTGGLLAAEIAAVPLLDLMTADVDWYGAGQGDDGWEQLESLERTEVYQATGMLINSLDVGAAEAVVRLRAYAFSHNMTASEVAWDIVERRLMLDSDEWRRGPDEPVRGGP
jgi:GAF domain/ANTAR domain